MRCVAVPHPSRFTLFLFLLYLRSVFSLFHFKNSETPRSPIFFPFLTPAVEIRDGGEPALGTRAVYKNYFFEILIFLKNWVKMKNVGPFF